MRLRGVKVGMFTAGLSGWNNKVAENIEAVIGLGDIVDNGYASAEWQRADSAAYRIVDRAAVPYAPVLGNHDYDQEMGLTKRATVLL